MSKPKIWQRGQTGSYYCTINGQQVKLGKTEEEAQNRYDYLMGVIGQQSIKRVDDLLAAFLDWVKVNRSEETFNIYLELLRQFVDSIGGLKICDLKPLPVFYFFDQQKGWNSTTQKKTATKNKRAFNWAGEVGHINLSPIAHLKKPPVRKRETLISPRIWQAIGKKVKDRAFRDFLMILRETGCRVQEARIVQANNVRKDTWLFPKINSKGQRFNRLVMLSPRAKRITRRLMKEHPEGPLFLNKFGKPWTRNAIICRFKRLSDFLGVKICAYSIRHTFCTEGLEKGLDSTTMGIILGHRDLSQVARTYSHLTTNLKHLRKSLKKVRSKKVKKNNGAVR